MINVYCRKIMADRRLERFLPFKMHYFYIIQFVSLYVSLSLCISFLASGGNLVKRSLKDTIKCYEDSKFYRNPERPTHKMWTNAECSKYYLCLDGEVFEFKCSVGLLFDVMRQICDFKQNVDNCDVTAGLFQVFFRNACPFHFIN